LRRARLALFAFAMGDQAKSLLPFLQRADEMAKADPKVAYYCRLYAVEEGMKIPDKSPELGEMLSLLVRQLEATKQAAGLLGAEDDEAHVENFALKIFAKADRFVRRRPARAPRTRPFPARGVNIERPAGRLIPRTSPRHAPSPAPRERPIASPPARPRPRAVQNAHPRPSPPPS
jgi:hypothetical protein